jgi:ankyrin repeat protein
MSDDGELITLMRAIAAGDHVKVGAALATNPELAVLALADGATRQESTEFFLGEITHHIYRGDTAVHVAAAAHDHRVVRDLVQLGAPTTVANRRGAQPLHYAADGLPDDRQAPTVACLVEFGADPDARDKNGTTPLLRAIRNRSAVAVEALLAAGADPDARNDNGSSAMELAHWTTGKSGSGTPEARQQQQRIIRLLEAAGAH